MLRGSRDLGLETKPLPIQKNVGVWSPNPIFQIWKGFWKPKLESPIKNLAHPWEPPNYLATLNPQRATERIKDWGWKSL